MQRLQKELTESIMAAMQHGSKVNNKLKSNMAAMQYSSRVNNNHIMAWALFSPGDANRSSRHVIVLEVGW